MRRRFPLTILFFVFALCSHAQTFAVKGTVSDELGFSLVGVSVVNKNSGLGTASDLDGNYEIRASKGDQLLFTYRDYPEQRITAIKKMPDVRIVKPEEETDAQVPNDTYYQKVISSMRNVREYVLPASDLHLVQHKPFDAIYVIDSDTVPYDTFVRLTPSDIASLDIQKSTRNRLESGGFAYRTVVIARTSFFVEGTVTNPEGKPYANIYIVNKTAGESTVSDAAGRYCIKASKGDEILFSKPGAFPRIHIADGPVADIQLITPEFTCVTGSVRDNTEPLIGVVVSVMGTKTQAYTDIDGMFTIDARYGDTLIFTYLGYKKKAVKIDYEVMSVELEEEPVQWGGRRW
ncbi:carboxypeptidase-like regulatory domain-containing protein [Prevotella sp. 10(H)]|uniref:carboxypeptidase-like regulatory domain-containing protein n=1 Tax=Prevotella sp. 10(H) TaxID=1158294 RepID=UPI0004A6B07B|nr:carboxypeptidase-like regulatory domain-containing protein [Prevotella sp. 10(H)]